MKVSGTENYADEAPELLKRYESISFADAHAPILHHQLRAALSISARGPGAMRQDLWPSGTRSLLSNRPKNFDVARCSCIHRR
jgi:hypothetical protein